MERKYCQDFDGEKTESWKKSSSLDYYRRPMHGNLIGDPLFFIGDHRFSSVTTDFHCIPQAFHQRRKLFLKTPNFLSENPFFIREPLFHWRPSKSLGWVSNEIGLRNEMLGFPDERLCLFNENN